MDGKNRQLGEAEFRNALICCRHYEQQWLHTRSSLRTNVVQQLVRAATPLVRSVLRTQSRWINSVVGRAKTIHGIADYLLCCRDFDLVSFDVFDTLLYRTVEPPDFIKRLSANYASQLLAEYGLPVHRDLFLYVRREEEARLRRRALANGFDTECKLGDLIKATLTRFGGETVANSEADPLIRYELDVEERHLRVAPDVIELLEKLSSQGKRLIAVSDTYFEAMHLEQFFECLGIKDYFSAFYSSADYSVGKYTGRLFEIVLRSEQVLPQRMVHVGDTYESDALGAIRRGVNAVYLRDTERLRRRRETNRRSRAITTGRANMQRAPGVVSNAQTVTDGGNELFAIGYNVFGPAFTSFILRIIEECYRWRVSDIYFLAREGFLLQQIYQIVTRNVRRFAALTPIDNHYLYLSRLATSLPALGADGRTLQLAQFRNANADLTDVLAAFGLSPYDFSGLIESTDIKHRNAVSEFVADSRIVARAELLAVGARQRLKNYLVNEGFFGGERPKALVDIGWSATIQANLTRAFYRDSDFPLLIGLYFGRRYAHEDDYALTPRSQFLPGVMFDERRFNRREHAINRCVEIFEISASAPHGATLGYIESNGQMVPQLSDHPQSLSREQQKLQAGILAYVEEFSQRYNDYETDTDVLLTQAAKRLERFICRPTKREVSALRNVHHSIDWGSTASKPLIAAEVTRGFVLKPARLLAMLRYCCWPEGTLRHSEIPGGLFLLSLLRRLVRSRQNLHKVADSCANFFRKRVQEPNDLKPVVALEAKINCVGEKVHN